jgi:hypothetical protein
VIAFWWLAIPVAFVSVLIIGASCYERWLRSDYRAYCQHRNAVKAQTEAYVPFAPSVREHKPSNISRAGIVK